MFNIANREQEMNFAFLNLIYKMALRVKWFHDIYQQSVFDAHVAYSCAYLIVRTGIRMIRSKSAEK